MSNRLEPGFGQFPGAASVVLLRFRATRLLVLALLSLPFPAARGGSAPPSDRWWPSQKPPRGVVKTDVSLFKPIAARDGKPAPEGVGPEHMLVESIAGLAAQAVNEGRLDEMVWIGLGDHKDYLRWYDGMAKRLKVEERGTLKPWELVDRYAKRRVIKGYILYSFDRSPGHVTFLRPGTDTSANVGTALAGLMGGILICEEQEDAAKAMGLARLFDARGKSVAWCLETYKGSLNRSFALAQDPKMPQNRDIAIANRMLVVWGTEEPTPSVYAWLNPLSSIIGWNAGDEGRCVSQISEHGHILLPSNWAMNLSLLSAGTDSGPPAAKCKPFDPRSIPPHDRSSAVAFVMSDGDNVQWMMGNFCSHPSYWASPDHGRFPFGWGVPLGCLDQACPEALAYLATTQRQQTTLIQHNGGYFYPDLLGSRLPREQREELLVQHARRIGHAMQRAGTRTLMLLCMDIDSADARHAYEVYAREIDELVGMLAIQYAPYEVGDGRVYWVRDRSGVEIPVVTAKFCIWANLRNPRSGTPAKIASLINQAAAHSEAAGEPLLCWAMTHAWSGFRKVGGSHTDAENVPPEGQDGERGVSPTLWCVEGLSKRIRVVSPEELLWRIRMWHDPQATQAAIK